MAVDPNVSRSILETELALVRPLAETYGWTIETEMDRLRFTVRLRSAVDHEEYILEFTCDDYKERPPYVEFIDPVTGERGVASAYPRNGNSYFNPTPFICAQFNRKAYSEHGGPHGDWAMLSWQQLRPEFSLLGDMIHLIQRLVDNPQVYHGRMAPLRAREAS